MPLFCSLIRQGSWNVFTLLYVNHNSFIDQIKGSSLIASFDPWELTISHVGMAANFINFQQMILDWLIKKWSFELEFCLGKPWSMENCLNNDFESVWSTSEGEKIQRVLLKRCCIIYSYPL